MMMQVDVNRRHRGLLSTEISTIDSQETEKKFSRRGGEAFRLKGLGSSVFLAC